jgi:outer membrane protein TolC
MRPAVPTPLEYKDVEQHSAATPGVDWRKAMPADAAKRGEWWVLFNDKELDNLEVKAGTANQNIKAAEASFGQACALVHQAKSGYYPTVQVGQSANILTNPLSKLDVHDASFPTSLNQFTLLGTIAWEPDLWGRVRKQVEADVAAAQASAADIANVQLEIQTELALDYVQIRGLDEELRLYQQTIANDERTLDLTREKQRSGVASDVDVKQAEASSMLL